MRNAIVVCFAVALLAAFGCERKSDTGSTSPTTPSAPAGKKDDHEHKPGEKHADDHADEDGHDHDKGGHGEERELGTVEIGGISVKVAYHGAVAAGKEADFDVHIGQGSEKVTAARLWVGTPDGKGAMKAKATINKHEAHNHVEVPNPLPADAKLCIELELTGGEKKVGTLPLPK